LSQPAVSSQIKRIQALVGGQIFNKTANGSVVTPLGKLVLNQSRRILEANDQMLRLGGVAEGRAPPLRLGLNTLFARAFLQSLDNKTLPNVVIHSDNSIGIAKGVLDGYIDIAVIFDNPEIGVEMADLIVKEQPEAAVWVRSKNFVLSPGAPIPVLTWFGDDLMLRTLTRQGLQYRVVFSSPDHNARLTATEAGLGLMAIPERFVPSNLVRAREYYLPPLPPTKALLCMRAGLNDPAALDLQRWLLGLFFEDPMQSAV
jgi:DNA-binding transcriptional LysR family regulator